MSITAAVLSGRILDRLNDVNPQEQAVGPFRLRAIINAQTNLLASRTIRPRETVQSIALVANTYDYTLASSGLVANVAQVFLNTDGIELSYRPFEEFNSIYRQATANPASSGEPREYTVWETAGQVATLRVGPTPDSAADGPLKVYHSIMPVMLSNASYSNLTWDATVIPFGNELIAGLEAACCAEAASIMPEAAAARLGIDKAVAIPAWRAMTEQAIREHNNRQWRLGRRRDHVARTAGDHVFWGWAR